MRYFSLDSAPLSPPTPLPPLRPVILNKGRKNQHLRLFQLGLFTAGIGSSGCTEQIFDAVLAEAATAADAGPAPTRSDSPPVVPEPRLPAPPIPPTTQPQDAGTFDAQGPTTPEAGAPLPTPCQLARQSALSVGRFELRLGPDAACLYPTDIQQGPTEYDVGLNVNCDGGVLQLWEISADGDNMRVRSVALDMVWDIRAQSPSDGAPLIVFPQVDQDNQRFAIRARGLETFEAAPVHAETSCLTAQGSGVELLGCDSGNEDQAFEVHKLECQAYTQELPAE